MLATGSITSSTFALPVGSRCERIHVDLDLPFLQHSAEHIGSHSEVPVRRHSAQLVRRRVLRSFDVFDLDNPQPQLLLPSEHRPRHSNKSLPCLPFSDIEHCRCIVRLQADELDLPLLPQPPGFLQYSLDSRCLFRVDRRPLHSPSPRPEEVETFVRDSHARSPSKIACVRFDGCLGWGTTTPPALSSTSTDPPSILPSSLLCPSTPSASSDTILPVDT
ncbi:hypothetical protein BLNAU_979 [Blattamonas nauphoetae]|uniref:Uncharacterized protein n=1 Tax=Blattamonas nauphoetae TaxID=2049346 RepID=A0ABQ9YJG4_9EUKA|nr:hypothetical protein BLNAU_979 [Blattamonas nauphoetae]